MLCLDKVALVTGGSGNGMGRSIALTLAREGADVIVNYRKNHKQAEKVAHAIQNMGRKSIALQADIFDKTDSEKLIEKSIEVFQKIDIYVVGPGSGWHQEPIHKINPIESMQDVINEVNPIYYMFSLLLPKMYEMKFGRIVAITVHPTKKPPAYSYNVAKGARENAMLMASEEAYKHGVTINVVAPGPVEMIPDLETAIKYCKGALKSEKLSPQDVAEGVAFLCSEKADYITACVIPYF
ncbi:SDR family oxidoreductase [candidate division WOR-3 bacterium]|nr:SDR family oxidoreductase [candidate division WOR-3 bacterium]